MKVGMIEQARALYPQLKQTVAALHTLHGTLNELTVLAGIQITADDLHRYFWSVEPDEITPWMTADFLAFQTEVLERDQVTGL